MSATLSHLFLHRRSNNRKPKLLHVEGIALLIAIVVGSSGISRFFSVSRGPIPAILGFSSTIQANDVVTQTNAKRQQSGLSTLTINPQLVAAAAAKGHDMCTNQYWAHISPAGATPWIFMKGAGYKYSVAGENLARDFGDTGSMMDAWMASPTHKANIVNPKYKEIGIAVINCSLLGSDTALVVQMFGSQYVGVAKAQTSPSAANNTAQVKSLTTDVLPESTQVAGQESAPQALAQADPSLVLPQASDSSSVSSATALFTPVQFQKAFMISILALITFVLIIDMWLVEERKVVRISSRSLGHFLFLSGILIVVLILKAGVVL